MPPLNTIFVFCVFYTLTFSYSIASEGSSEENSSEIFLHALPYAELSAAIYNGKSSLIKAANEHKLKLTQFNRITNLEIAFAILKNTNTKEYIIVIRGTSNSENAIVDMDIKLVPDDLTGIVAHQGFLQASTTIYQYLVNKLEKDYLVSTTGHSLGGAVAMLLAMQMHANGYEIGEVVSFGQPKVTNIEGAQKFKEIKVSRFVRSKDLVPIVPPVDLIDIQNIDIYWHLGKEIILMGNNKYAELEGVKSMLRSADFLSTIPNQENIENHMMISYLALIKENAFLAHKTEYKSSFSFKRLFRSE